MHVFLCGPRHIGKSTVVKNVIEELNSKNAIGLGGFITYVGRGDDLNIYMSSAKELQRYEVDNLVAKRTSGLAYPFPQVFDSLGVSILEKCKSVSNLICMDELGFLESEAYAFQDAVLKCLEETIPILGVVKEAPIPWLKRIKNHPKVKLIDVSKENRDFLVPRILNILEVSINQRYNSR